MEKFLFIPLAVAHDKRLTAGAKVFYGDLLYLCGTKTNTHKELNFLSSFSQASKGAVCRWIEELKVNNYITVTSFKLNTGVDELKIKMIPLEKQ